ncbi:MAG: HEAT repeat domain-containing protein, partial [candidate division Zixibacteria bacterium]|nr:HEAT repeat domain-containing protein [candidate division Zixibacteria bacterium]
SHTGRMGKENYVDAEFVFLLTLPSSGDTVFRQATVMLTESNIEGGAKPIEIPDSKQLVAEVVPLLAGSLGRFAPLQTMINSTSLAERRKAVELLEEIGHPSAVTVLKGRLDIEKDRRLKSRIEKAIEKLQPK